MRKFFSWVVVLFFFTIMVSLLSEMAKGFSGRFALGYVFIGLSLLFYFVYFASKYIFKEKITDRLSHVNPYRFIFNGGKLGKSTVAPTVLMVFLVLSLTLGSFISDKSIHFTIPNLIRYALAVLYVVILWYLYILQVKNNNTTQD